LRRKALVPGAVVLLLLLGGSVSAAVAQSEQAATAATDTGTVRRSDAGPLPTQTSFAQSQLRHDRVLAARVEARFQVKRLFRERGIHYPAAEIFMRIFKRERQLELWVRSGVNEPFALLKTYQICALAGGLGPKRRQGDEQVPEGFYNIDRFNPESDYLLSLHLDYPNRSDALLGSGGALGGDIYIHGGCNSAGCLALTDDGIKEVYWISVEARGAGQTRIPVHIFPARLTEAEMPRLAQAFRSTPAVLRFWQNLKPGFEYFEREHRVPRMTVAASGSYQLEGEDRLNSPAPLGTPVAQPLGTPLPATTGNQPPPRPLGDTAQAAQQTSPDSARTVRPIAPVMPGGGS
jgi:murein L,D-transpeptidase YafK